MIVIYNENCSKCARLQETLSDAGIEWEGRQYMEGELSTELLDQVFTLYRGPRADLIRCGEKAWIEAGHDIGKIDLPTLKRFVLENPVILQRPIVIREGEALLARSTEQLDELLGN